MKIKTLYTILLLFVGLNFASCGSKGPASALMTPEQIEKSLAKDKKKKAKAGKKASKDAYKHYWSLQSKDAKKSIKRNDRARKRVARRRNKGKPH
ncbi:MAG: putative small lipoprotein YifL [Flavobacteriaceae bacterium]|jgi:predicted small lipoprotein YifL